DRRLEQAEEDGRRGIFRAMVGDRAGEIDYFLTSWPVAQPPPGPGGNTLQQAFDQSALKFGIGIMKAVGMRDLDLRMYLETMEQFIAASTNDFPEMLHRGEVAERESTERLSHGMAQLAFLTRLMIPAVSRAFNKEVALATRLRSARVAIAVEKYRLAHKGALPENLGDLVPEF